MYIRKIVLQVVSICVALKYTFILQCKPVSWNRKVSDVICVHITHKIVNFFFFEELNGLVFQKPIIKYFFNIVV